MQVTELSAQGLKREFRVTVPADEIASRVNSRLQRLQQTVRMPGFRPGKAPMPLLKKQYGRSVMGEVLEEAVEEGARTAVEERQLRPALRPKVDVTSFDEGKDLEFRVDLELLPEVPEVDLAAIQLERLTTPIEEGKIEDALQGLARARQTFTAPAETRPAADGDQVVIDFAGRIDGELFEGGSGSDFALTLGSKSMIPGFEDQILGMSPGETRQIAVTFPEDYNRTEFAGKPATFDITVKEVKEAVPVTLDEEWAKGLGAEGGLDEVRSHLRERMEQEYAGITRTRMKRQLLDQLAGRYGFQVPEGMVEIEFDAIWKQLKDEMERTGASPEEEGKDEAELKAEYRKIAERRVRLGLILSDIGNRNGVRVENEELQRAVYREALRFPPAQHQRVFQYFQNNPAALEQLRAPLFEDKVCDLIFGQAKVEERQVPVEELMRDPDEAALTATGSEETAPPAVAAADAPAAPAEVPQGEAQADEAKPASE